MPDIYLVGGAVRDRLMGLVPKDLDYVVVGSSVEEMLSAGYSQVGADFPVFLHPDTQDEYALARTERKTAKGYGGFAVNTDQVTLEDDLSRRDLTINAMAMVADGSVIDPFKGQGDLQNRVLRHVSEAFAEDPLRVLRVARFKARLGANWSIADETLQLMQSMVESGELDHLTKERVWIEFEKGFKEPHPQLMLELLNQLNLFERPSFAEYKLFQLNLLNKLPPAELLQLSFPARVALALPRTWTAEEGKSSRIPAAIRDACHVVYLAEQTQVSKYLTWPVGTQLAFLEKLDVFRRAARFNVLCEVLAITYPSIASAMQIAVCKIKRLNQQELVAGLHNVGDIKAAITKARISQM